MFVHAGHTAKVNDISWNPDVCVFIGYDAVSYTHLDVYKRQVISRMGFVSTKQTQSLCYEQQFYSVAGNVRTES